MTHDEMIAVILHRKNGGKVQFSDKESTSEWRDVTPTWDFSRYNYRKKPESLVLWVIVNGKRLVVCSVHESYIKSEFEKFGSETEYTLKKFVEVAE